uniref:NAD(+) ADP-ribosyltransferase n=1 Tax=Haemonchus contortus TaxID=6289 RepID=A0A7I4XUH3_HAECO
MSGGAGVDWHDEMDIPKMELLNAAYEGNITKVGELLRMGVNIDSYDDDHVTALQIAAFNGNNAMVTYLLDEGADLEACNQVGMTPFHHACREGRMTVVETLLQRGADIHRTTFMGATALTLAAAGAHLHVVKKLVSLRLEVSPPTMGLCPTPLIAAAFRSSPQICGFLIHRGAPIDETLDSLLGLSALSCVLMCSSTSVFCALLDLGADPTKKTLKKKTAAELAEQFKRHDVLAILADKSRIRHHDRIAVGDIRQLIAENQLDSAEFTRGKQTPLAEGATPLMFAVAVGNERAVRRLIDLRVEVNEVESRHGLTALQIASLLRLDNCVFVLLMNEARTVDLNVLNMSAFDLYLTSNEEPDPNLRAMLHTCRPSRLEGKLNLSGSSSTLSKVLTTGRPKEWLSRFSSQLGLLSESQTASSVMDMRQWRDYWVRNSGTDGRFWKKLVTAEEILRMTKNATPLKTITYDTVLDAVKKMAQQSQSFLVNCFYDSYVGDVKREIDNESDSYKWEYYDRAQMYTSQCGYQQSKRRVISPRDSIVVHRREGSDGNRKPRSLSFLESPSQNQMRTTPRMLKKSRDSMVMDEMVPRSTYDQLRKVASTPLLVQVPTMLSTPHFRLALSQSDRRRTVEERIWGELRKHNLAQYIDVFQKEEIDAESFFTLNDHDLKNLGIASPAHRATILSIKNHLISIS